MNERIFRGDLQILLANPDERVALLRQILPVTVRELAFPSQVEWLGGFGSFFDPTNPEPHDVDLVAQVVRIDPNEWIGQNEGIFQASTKLQLGLNCQIMSFDLTSEDLLPYTKDYWLGFIHNLTDLYGSRPVWLQDFPTRDF